MCLQAELHTDLAHISLNCLLGHAKLQDLSEVSFISMSGIHLPRPRSRKSEVTILS